MSQPFTDDVWSLSERFVSCPNSVSAAGAKAVELASVLIVVDDSNPASGFTKTIAEHTFFRHVPNGSKAPQCRHNVCGRQTGNGYEFASLPAAKQDLAIVVLPNVSTEGKNIYVLLFLLHFNSDYLICFSFE